MKRSPLKRKGRLRKRGARAEREAEALKAGREATLLRARGCCEVCGARAWLDVHHIRSRARNPGAPWLHDPSNLKAACRRCHEILHGVTFG